MDHVCTASSEKLTQLLQAYPENRKYALAVLQDIQKQFRYIPPESIGEIAAYLKTPAAEIYAMATFYKAFTLSPKGKHVVKVCDGTACHIRGSQRLADAIARYLDISPGETTADGMFSLEMVNCLGACALAPAMAVDETYYGNLTPQSLKDVLARYRAQDEEGGLAIE